MKLLQDLLSLNEGKNHLGEKEYTSFASWKAAVKKAYPDVWFDGDKDIANAMVGPKPYKRGETKGVGEWDGYSGEVYKFDADGKILPEGLDKSRVGFLFQLLERQNMSSKLKLAPVPVGHLSPESMPELKDEVFTISLRSPVTEALADMLGVPKDGTAYKIRTGYMTRDEQNQLLAFAKNKYDLPTQVKNRPKDWLMKEAVDYELREKMMARIEGFFGTLESLEWSKLSTEDMTTMYTTLLDKKLVKPI